MPCAFYAPPSDVTLHPVLCSRGSVLCLETDVLYQSSLLPTSPTDVISGSMNQAPLLECHEQMSSQRGQNKPLADRPMGLLFLLRAYVFLNLRKCGYLDTGLQHRLCSRVINVFYRRHAGGWVSRENPHHKYHFGPV